MNQKSSKELLLTEVKIASIHFGFFGTISGFLVTPFNCVTTVIFPINSIGIFGVQRNTFLGILLPGILGWIIGTAFGAFMGLVNGFAIRQAKPLEIKFYTMIGIFLGLHPGFPVGFGLLNSIFEILDPQWRVNVPNLVCLYIFPVIAFGCLGGWWGHWVATRSDSKEFPTQN